MANIGIYMELLTLLLLFCFTVFALLVVCNVSSLWSNITLCALGGVRLGETTVVAVEKSILASATLIHTITRFLYVFRFLWSTN